MLYCPGKYFIHRRKINIARTRCFIIRVLFYAQTENNLLTTDVSYTQWEHLPTFLLSNQYMLVIKVLSLPPSHQHTAHLPVFTVPKSPLTGTNLTADKW